jgi:hypothetical protein
MSLAELPGVERMLLAVVEAVPVQHPGYATFEPFPVFGWVVRHPDGPIVVDTGTGHRAGGGPRRRRLQPVRQLARRHRPQVRGAAGPLRGRRPRRGRDPQAILYVAPSLAAGDTETVLLDMTEYAGPCVSKVMAGRDLRSGGRGLRARPART